MHMLNRFFAYAHTLFCQRPRSAISPKDRGFATIEFVLIAVVIIVPIMYAGLCVVHLNRYSLAVTQAAREAGRAFATSPGLDRAESRVRQAVNLALEDQGLSSPDASVTYAAIGSDCRSRYQPSLAADERFTICVKAYYVLPIIPSILLPSRNSVVGQFDVSVNHFRSRS